MPKPKKKLTAAQRAAKQQRKKDFMTIFINGKQKCVRRPPTIDGMDPEEFILQNASPIWLHQHGYYEILHKQAEAEVSATPPAPPKRRADDSAAAGVDDDDLPF